jgi:sugar O-acyltransferase (sialic acid O-acetyltransferase NeuD family)
MHDKWLIIGAGGFAREIAGYILSDPATRDGDLEPSISFVVERPYFEAKTIDNCEVLDISKADLSHGKILVAIADPITRERIANTYCKGLKVASYVHGSAYIASNASIGEGAIIGPQCMINVGAVVGPYFHANPATLIGHDCVIGSFVTATPRTTIGGHCSVGDLVYFGAGSCIKDRVAIGSKSIIGMGSVVVSDAEPEFIYAGAPAKKIRRAI